MMGFGLFGEDEGKRLWDRFLKLGKPSSLLNTAGRSDLTDFPGPIVDKRVQMPYNKVSTIADPQCAMPGTKVARGGHFSSFDYETVKKAYDVWLTVAAVAPISHVVYEFYPYDKVASVAVEATAFAQRTKV